MRVSAFSKWKFDSLEHCAQSVDDHMSYIQCAYGVCDCSWRENFFAYTNFQGDESSSLCVCALICDCMLVTECQHSHLTLCSVTVWISWATKTYIRYTPHMPRYCRVWSMVDDVVDPSTTSWNCQGTSINILRLLNFLKGISVRQFPCPKKDDPNHFGRFLWCLSCTQRKLTK